MYTDLKDQLAAELDAIEEAGSWSLRSVYMVEILLRDGEQGWLTSDGRGGG